ncbi:hypothetical protein AMECASPLE_027176 [Ameca splendens]|uniref:Uncharacterized protein n=1 Tax=Ameca splendens TaxID=208324 RepID=A0ABV1A253_9TELE
MQKDPFWDSKQGPSHFKATVPTTDQQCSPYFTIHQHTIETVYKQSKTLLSIRALVSEVSKQPMITLEELQRFTAQVSESVDRKTISHALKICFLMNHDKMNATAERK